MCRANLLKLILSIVSVALLACDSTVAERDSPKPKRDINAVLATHQDRLMAIPGVVGIYVGLAEDNKTECLRVMLLSDNPETKRALPRQLEGYRVLTEITGEIRPLASP